MSLGTDKEKTLLSPANLEIPIRRSSIPCSCDALTRLLFSVLIFSAKSVPLYTSDLQG